MKQSYSWMSALLLACLTLLSCGKEKEQGPPPAEFYLVIDTSGSMASGTMKRVKEKLPAVLDSVRAGDRLHLMQFDEKTLSIGDFTVQTPEDRKVIEKAIADLKPSGAYTDIKQLIAQLKERSLPQDPASPQYIIVLSDGIDDPRPGKKGRKDRVQLKEYEAEKKLSVQEPYIFYIDLGGSKNAVAEKGLKEDLKAVSHDVKVVKAGEGDGVGVAEVQRQIDATRQPDTQPAWKSLLESLWAQTKALPLWVWGAVAAVLLLLLLMLMRLFRTQKPLEGVLSYYEASEHWSSAREVNLHKFRRDDLTIGSAVGSVIRIKEKEFPAQMRLKAKRSGKDFLFKPAKKDLQRMEFLVQKKRGFISSGDRFRVTNYTFEYSHGTKK